MVVRPDYRARTPAGLERQGGEEERRDAAIQGVKRDARHKRNNSRGPKCPRAVSDTLTPFAFVFPKSPTEVVRPMTGWLAVIYPFSHARQNSSPCRPIVQFYSY